MDREFLLQSLAVTVLGVLAMTFGPSALRAACELTVVLYDGRW